MPSSYLKWFAVLLLILLTTSVGYWFGTQHNTSSTQPTPSLTEAEPMNTNRLAQETSPYLRLHQHNPVDWYPWGPEAFEKARTEDKPIFLSVGYSSCYWCHVMERLVFSDLEIAKLMNSLFVNVKVDREERPDIDALYMTATQLLDGHGGWPNSVFLTPDLKPFYAGTYFPPQDAHGRPGFPRVLQALHLAWQEKRQDINDQSEQIAQAIRNIHTSQKADTSWSQSAFTNKLQTHFQNRFDWQNGGFGSAPKFPPDQALAILLDHSQTIPDATDMVSLTLTKMAQGGIQDHLGGGFHRYSTDAQWHVPHFEKMLYNQSLFAQSYLQAYQATQNPIYRQTVEDILRFVSTTLTDPKGGFYSALDAETDAEEGAHYIWTETEIRNILGSESDLFFEAFALAPVPETQAGALYRTQLDSALAQEKNIDITDIHTQLSQAKNRLLQERNHRKFPLLDDKIITGWNGLMIAAYAQSARILNRPQDTAPAQKAAEFILNNLRDKSGTLYRIYHSGQRKIPAYQEDYAYFIHGLIELYRTTKNATFLNEAEHLTQQMNTRFGDTQNGGYFFTPSDTELFVRAKNSSDGAIPSGNAVALHNLCDLYEITGQSHYVDQANTLFLAFSKNALESPEGYLHLIHGALRISQTEPQTSATQTAPTEQYVHAKLHLITSPDRPGDTLHAEVEIQIAKDWHIQAANPNHKFLIATQLQIATRDTLEDLNITYPEPTRVPLAIAESPVDVYTGTLRIPITCRVTPHQLNKAHLAFNLTYQACDDTRCLQPNTITLPLDIAF
ncbi:MAG: hypothetical protein ACI8V2_003838 [Candidatus Latescibacterota bacterium]